MLFSSQVEWPMSIVVSKMAMLQYQLIFRHLFELKHVERQLNAAWQLYQTTRGLYRQVQLIKSVCMQCRYPVCAQPLLHCCLAADAALLAQPAIAPTVSLHCSTAAWWPAAAPGVLCMLGLPSWGCSVCTAAWCNHIPFSLENHDAAPKICHLPKVMMQPPTFVFCLPADGPIPRCSAPTASASS